MDTVKISNPDAGDAFEFLQRSAPKSSGIFSRLKISEGPITVPRQSFFRYLFSTREARLPSTAAVDDARAAVALRLHAHLLCTTHLQRARPVQRIISLQLVIISARS